MANGVGGAEGKHIHDLKLAVYSMAIEAASTAPVTRRKGGKSACVMEDWK
jgi:hypothetical protein